MRLVIDMQGAQSTGSRNRGIGRYTLSLVKEVLRQRTEDEVLLLLNGAFAETIQPLREEFSKLLPAECIRVWMPPMPCNALDEAHSGKRKAAEIIREAYIVSLSPDMLLVTSLFEGLSDDAVTSIGEFAGVVPTAVVLYDLIPLIHSKIYLENPVIRQWYLNKLDQLRRSHLLLSISASSGREGVDYLSFSEEQVVNISTACDDHFRPMEVDSVRKDELASRYGLARPFVMYTGGIDHRKNIEGLIRAYALLPSAVRKQHQLAVVCSAHEADQLRLMELAKAKGLSDDEFIMTGFVPEDDLVALYNTCKLFVFPSWHEGFGLPALEAMACGRPVIGSNLSSIPEVIGNKDAMFDPHDDVAICEKMRIALTDNIFREKLIDTGTLQTKQFSWTISAQRAWLAIRTFAAKRKTSVPTELNQRLQRRPRMAYVSPLPSARSGIADYSAELLPELSRFYEIDVVVEQEETLDDPWVLANCTIRNLDWFSQYGATYERVLYHFGNSHFHSHMFKFVEEIPGVIVQHDFFLSGIVAYMDALGLDTGGWARALLYSHDWTAVQRRFNETDSAKIVYAYPANKNVLHAAIGVIVHSENSRRLAENWYGAGCASDWALIPHMRVAIRDVDREAARKRLGIAPGDFLVCSFGLLGRTKLNHRLLDAWLASSLNATKQCRLVFVGQNDGGDYGVDLQQTIHQSRDRIEITGWVDTEDYRLWLSAADVAVQLRTLSRGETSGTVLDCMNYGLPTIINAHGSLADMPENVVVKLPDEFDDDQLVNALNSLWKDSDAREALGKQARQEILVKHNPRHCAELYAKAIEGFYSKADLGTAGLSEALARIEPPLTVDDQVEAASVIAENFSSKYRSRRLLVDVSSLISAALPEAIAHLESMREELVSLLFGSIDGWQVELVQGGRDGLYRYARRYACELLNVPQDWADDSILECWAGDIFVAFGGHAEVLRCCKVELDRMRTRGISIYFYVPDALLSRLSGNSDDDRLSERFAWIAETAPFQGVLLSSAADSEQLIPCMEVFANSRSEPLDFFVAPASSDTKSSLWSWISALTRGDVLTSWNSTDQVKRYWGADARLSSQMGRRLGKAIHTTKQEGFLLFGPYEYLEAGSYVCQIFGQALSCTGEEFIDIACEKGNVQLAHSMFNVNQGGSFNTKINFELPQAISDFELRFWVDSETDISIELVEFDKLFSAARF